MGLLDNFGSQVGTYLGDKENLLNLASGFASMSGNPNTASIMAGIQNQKESLMKRRDVKAAQNLATSQATGQRNKTAEMLIAKGGKYAEIGNQLQNGSITFEQARDDYQTLSKFEMEQGVKKPSVTWSQLPITEVMKRGYDPSVPLQISSDGKITTINSGGGTNVDVVTKNIIGGEGDTGAASRELFKDVGKGGAKTINAFADDYEPALKTLNSIDTLQRLGDIMETTTSVPAWARGFVPEGVSGSINAYDAVVKSVAQGMRVAGSGPMTDNDFKVLLSRAGSSSLDKDARMVIHAGLRAAAQRRVDLGAAAQAFQLNPNQANLSVYQETIKEIRNRPLFTEEERNYLESFGSEVDSSSIDQTYQTYFGQLTQARQARFAQMSPSTQKKFYNSWLAGKTQ
jgi:hypothetical protein